MNMENLHPWQKDASCPTEYHTCEMRRGCEFIVQMMSGADPLLALAEFAKNNNIPSIPKTGTANGKRCVRT